MTALPAGYSGFVPKITYLIDDINIFSEYGIVVKNSSGIISQPAVKQPFLQVWGDAHGEVVDNSKVYYEAKEITLDCWLMGTSNLSVTELLNNFYTMLRTPNLKRLMVYIDANKPLIYQVYLKGDININKKWKPGVSMANFSVTLREPEPLKWVLQGTVYPDTSVSIRVSCTNPINVRWGNADQYNDDSFDIVGTNLLTQEFGNYSGKVYPIITGDVDSITAFTLTGLTQLWTRLL